MFDGEIFFILPANSVLKSGGLLNMKHSPVLDEQRLLYRELKSINE
jgi:hypothetical protein